MSVAVTDPALLPAELPPPQPTPPPAITTGLAGAKERHSLTLDQRRALRRWANSQGVRPSHKQCIEWFYSQFGQQISQSTVSHSLSPKYSRLDGDNPQLSGSRLRFGNWPDVEKLVLMWYQQVQQSGRQPTNEELGDKAKTIFSQLPRYREEEPPEFSPGWIHRFKKRYGLLVRRQRRHGDGGMNPADDIEYLADCVPRFMAVATDTSPAAIREEVLRVIGVEATLNTCALVRDEIIRRLAGPSPPPPGPQHHLDQPHQQEVEQHDHHHHAAHDPHPHDPHTHDPHPHDPHTHDSHPHDPHAHDSHTHDPHAHDPNAQHEQHEQHEQHDPHDIPAEQHLYTVDDPEMALQNALRQLQQEEQAAEEQAAAVREERERAERAGLPPPVVVTTPVVPRASPDQRFVTPAQDLASELTLTPINSEGPISSTERPVRCPYCINHRLLRTIKEAVEHMSTHVVV